MSTRRAAIAAGLTTAVLGVPSTAVAAESAVPVGSGAALAGDRVVTVVGHAPHPARVVSRATGGGSVRLATLSPRGHRRANYYVVTVAASATTWAVAINAAFVPNDDEELDRERGELIVSGSTAGGPPRTLASCARSEEVEDPEPIDLAVAGDDVAWSSSSCPGATGVRLAPAGGGPVALVAADGAFVALTPAWLGFFTYADQHELIEVLDRASGAARTIPDEGISAFALGDTGLDAVIAPDHPGCSDGCRMSIRRVAADGTIMRPGLAATPATVPGPGSDPLVPGGGRVLGERAHGNGVVAVDLATGAVSYAGALGLDFGGTTPIAVDATRAAYTAPRCDGTMQLRIERTRPSAPARLAHVPCPVRVLTHAVTLRPGRRTARLAIRCPRGCDEDWDVLYHGRYIGYLFPVARARHTRHVVVTFETLERLRRGRRATVTLAPDTYDRSHPRAAQQAPVRLVVRRR
jgi:hypothetical protein